VVSDGSADGELLAQRGGQPPPHTPAAARRTLSHGVPASARRQPLAAFGNGMAAHSDETDDSHPASLSHPCCSIVPAAPALAEAYGRTGPRNVWRSFI
jgi:2-methylcitrate dehydratase PrpD